MKKKKDIFKMSKKELIEVFKNGAQLINERININNEINNTNKNIEEINSTFIKSKKKLNDNKKYWKDKYKTDFVNRFKFIFAFIISVILVKGSHHIFVTIFCFILYFFILKFIGELIAKRIYNKIDHYFDDKVENEYKKEEEEILNLESNSKEKIENLNEKINELKLEKVNVQQELNDIDLDDVHDDYKNLDVWILFVDYLERGRCDTLKECINLYEQEKKNSQFGNMIDSVKNNVNKQISNVNEKIGGLDNKIDNVNSKASKGIEVASVVWDNRRGKKNFDDANKEIDKLINK